MPRNDMEGSNLTLLPIFFNMLFAFNIHVNWAKDEPTTSIPQNQKGGMKKW